MNSNYSVNDLYNDIDRYNTLKDKYATLRSKINLLIDSFEELKSDFHNVDILLEEGIVIGGKPLGNGVFNQDNTYINKYLSQLKNARGYCSRRITEINADIEQSMAEIEVMNTSNEDASM